MIMMTVIFVIYFVLLKKEQWFHILKKSIVFVYKLIKYHRIVSNILIIKISQFGYPPNIILVNLLDSDWLKPCRLNINRHSVPWIMRGVNTKCQLENKQL